MGAGGKKASPKVSKSAKLPRTVPRPWGIGCVGRAFEAGDRAFGVRFEQRGFGRTADDDRLFALGYPHMVLPADVEIDLAALAEKDGLHKAYYPWRPGVWPRGLVERFVAACGAPEGDEITAPVPALDFEKVAPRIALNEDPYPEILLYMVEALFGTKRTLEAAIGAWEAVDDWKARAGHDMSNAAPFLLLRVDESDRRTFTARIAAVHARAAAQIGGEWSRCVPALARAAGKIEEERSLWCARYAAPSDGAAIELVVDEMAKLKPADRAQFDGRLAFLGGARTAKAVADAAGAARFHVSWIKSAVEQLARMSHPAAAAALRALAAKDVDAKAWVAEHAAV